MKLSRKELISLINESLEFEESYEPFDFFTEPRNKKEKKQSLDNGRQSKIASIASVIMIQLLGYQPEEGSPEFEKVYDTAEAILRELSNHTVEV